MTEIGERGINLSGGQKQRISIARAVYSNSDIYLIDDALSALDAAVGKKILENVFMGLLKDKTRILITHHLHILEHVNEVVLLKNGEVVQIGKFSDIKKTEEYKVFSDETAKKYESTVLDCDLSILSKNKTESKKSRKKYSIDENLEMEKLDAIKKKSVSYKGPNSKQINDIEVKQLDKQDSDEKKSDEKLDGLKEGQKEEVKKGQLTTKEKRQTGFTGFKAFYHYIQEAGTPLLVFNSIVFIAVIVFKMASEWWVAQWATNTYKNLSNTDYSLIYLALVLIAGAFVFIRAISMAIQYSRTAFIYHSKMVDTLIRRPMSYFDTTHTG